MHFPRRRVLQQSGIGLALAGWTALTGYALVTVHGATGSTVDELVDDATILPVVFVGYALAQRYWPAVPDRQTQHAVAQVRIGRGVIGSAFRTRGRYVVTSSRVVNLALNRSADEVAAPHDRARVDLFFPGAAGTGGDVQVSAQVLEWGPTRRDLFRNDVVVLRTVERLPRRIPSLRIARRPFEGAAHIVLPFAGPHPDATSAEHSEIDVEIHDQRLSAPPAGPSAPAGTSLGAPVLATVTAGGDDASEVVALLGPDRRDPGGADPVPSLVMAADVQAVMRPISRRELLTAGALAGGTVALAGAGFVARTLPSGTAAQAAGGLTLLRGAGWDVLFDQPQVREYLRTKGFQVSVSRMSGVESVRRGDLSQYDFMTAPNGVIGRVLAGRLGTGSEGAAARPFCTEDMVLLVSRPVAEVLGRAGLLVQPRHRHSPDRGQRFDVAAYLRMRRRGVTWVDIGVSGPNGPESPRDPVKVTTADPALTGGGLMFLWLLASVMKEEMPTVPEEWLWKPGGQFYGLGRDETVQLLNDLADGHEQMVFVYEHDAINFLREDPTRIGSFVIVRTAPNMSVDQMIVTTHDQFADLFSNPDPQFQSILVNQFSLRVKGADQRINRLLATDLAPAVWAAGTHPPVRPGPELRGQELNLRAALTLLDRIERAS